jgi:hypothetical protein
MKPCLDHVTPADRIGTSLAAKRAAAIAYLRSRNKYIVDEGCNFVPTNAAKTDVKRTMVNAKAESIAQECGRFAMGVPSLMRRQAV